MPRKTLASVEASHHWCLKLLKERNEECQALRLRCSILEGELALRPRPTDYMSPTMARNRAPIPNSGSFLPE